MPTDAANTTRRSAGRATPLAARGEPYLWLTGAALGLCLLMIFSLIAVTVINGLASFWPHPVDSVQLRTGETMLGIRMDTESFTPGADDIETFDALKNAGALRPGDTDENGLPLRRLYRVGNRGSHPAPFTWVPLYDIETTSKDADTVMLERDEWGIWLGILEGVRTDAPEDAGTWGTLRDEIAKANHRKEKVHAITKGEIGEINYDLERSRLRFRKIEIAGARAGTVERSPVSLWAGALVALVATVVFGMLRFRARRLGMPFAMASIVAIALAMFVVLEYPFHAEVTQAEVADAEAALQDEVKALEGRYETVQATIDELDAIDDRYRAIVRDPFTGQIATTRPSEVDEPMRVSQIVRAFRPNSLSRLQRVGVYLSRWWEYLSENPREANTEGGVFPVIFGTVMLTLLLSVAVVPLGVIAALYIHEYARKGVLISIVRIAVNNLAGVPSIVYGVFGLGFFCYTVGKFIDVGPAAAWPRWLWWAGIGVLGSSIGAAIFVGLRARVPAAGRRTRAIGIVLWFAVAIVALSLVAATPYFSGFFEARTGRTFGTRGMLWASLTLALLTLPVVIVATEEALAAVPGSMREGSYGCGASKWQTIRRIVLPHATPGIMTGMILAMARGAGEVAPLMLVGAAKSAESLPVSGRFPFIHLDRSFMHLGFHIYDVGFQSSDSQAARPLVWTTTLLLLTIVFALNLAAIRLRAVLRRQMTGNAF